MTLSSGAKTNYAFNEDDELATYGAATSTAYVYDADGLRASKKVGTSAATRMVWDKTAGDADLLSDGSSTFVYGPGGLPVQQISSSGTSTYLHHDQLGSTRLITNSSGANVASYSFDAYGKQLAKTGSATTPLGYAGQYTDAESGLIYMRARYYDPATGTFISKDPIGSAGSGQNLYGYVGGDPTNAVDPSGLFLSGVGGFLGDHLGTITTVVAGGVCIVNPALCGAVMAASFGVNAVINVVKTARGDMCVSELLKRTAVDGALSLTGAYATKAVTGELGRAVGHVGAKPAPIGVRAVPVGSLTTAGAIAGEGEVPGCGC